MSSAYFLLFSHISVIFPISVCFWEFKTQRDFKALFTSVHLLYTACFSFGYHSYNYDGLKNQWDSDSTKYNMWFFLDHWASRNTIFVTVLYLGKFNTEYFYIFSHIGSIVILIGELTAPFQIRTFITLILSLLVVVFKVRTLFNYLKHFYFHTIFSITTLIVGIFCLLRHSEYETWHSVWHLLIFTAAGSGCLLKRRLENVGFSQGREPSDSI